MKKVVLLIVALLMIAVPALAEIKIAVVDMQKALTLSEEGKEAQAQIAEKVEAVKKKLEQKQADVEKLKEALSKQQSVLSADALATKEWEYQQERKNLDRAAKDEREELQKLDMQISNRILKKMLTLTEKIAKEEGYDLVLERSSSGIVFASDVVDLTNKVVAAADAAK